MSLECTGRARWEAMWAEVLDFTGSGTVVVGVKYGVWGAEMWAEVLDFAGSGTVVVGGQ